MYTLLKEFHSEFRWLVLALAVIVVIIFLIGFIAKRKYGKAENLTSLFYMISCDIQLLAGLVLYIFLSPATSSFAIDMSDPTSRFQSVEHPVTMLLAIVFAHIGRSKSKNAATDASKFKKGLIWFALSLIFMLSRMPWN
ncbi:MAG: hypothetical protein LH473_12740 [Chitinophagales bacterium]|nr:hypothetical protein [Chitinophagales bacterium]